jgi:hypothetical protein
MRPASRVRRRRCRPFVFSVGCSGSIVPSHFLPERRRAVWWRATRPPAKLASSCVMSCAKVGNARVYQRAQEREVGLSRRDMQPLWTLQHLARLVAAQRRHHISQPQVHDMRAVAEKARGGPGMRQPLLRRPRHRPQATACKAYIRHLADAHMHIGNRVHGDIHSGRLWNRLNRRARWGCHAAGRVARFLAAAAADRRVGERGHSGRGTSERWEGLNRTEGLGRF